MQKTITPIDNTVYIEREYHSDKIEQTIDNSIKAQREWVNLNVNERVKLLKNFVNTCSNCFIGSMVASDYFYNPNSNWYKPLMDMGVLAVDMETHLLYTLSMRFDKKALSINTVSDHLLGGESMSSKEREGGLNKMIENILESI